MPEPILERTDLVPAPETCKQLADAEFPQDTYFRWVQHGDKKPFLSTTWSSQNEAFTAVAAPTAIELGALLPGTIKVVNDMYLLKCQCLSDGPWECFYSHPYRSKLYKHSDESEAKARAWIWINLQKDNHL
jgi:hypothetical protein